MTTINVTEIIDASRVSRFQKVTVLLCGLLLIMDGFDVQMMGYVAPAIIEDWGASASEIGLVISIGLLGVMLGALIFTVVADRIGRRPVLVGATFFFSIMMIATAHATSVTELLILRFITGIGLGCVVPNATALAGEYSPRRLRVTIMMIVSVGFTAGAAFGGFIAAWLIPTFGWRSVFYFGGAVPFVLAVLMARWMPESLQFMVLHRRNRAQVDRWLTRIAPSAPVEGAELVVNEESRSGVPVLHLFRDGRALGTLLLWAVNFTNILDLYALSAWIPTIVERAGYATSTAVLIGATLQSAGTIGTFGLAWLIARRGFVPVLGVSFAIASLSLAVTGPSLSSLVGLVVVVVVSGWCIIGSQPGLNALSATFYPTYMRSTGIGWGLGIGRLGGFVGPWVGGQLLDQWSPNALFLLAAVPALLSTVIIFGLGKVLPSRHVGKADAEAA